MEYPSDNLMFLLLPCEGVLACDIAGSYRCEELEPEMTVSEARAVLYGRLSGFLRQSRMEMLEPVGPDMRVPPCQRPMDHTPPGDWTVAVRRGEDGRVIVVDVG